MGPICHSQKKEVRPDYMGRGGPMVKRAWSSRQQFVSPPGSPRYWKANSVWQADSHTHTAALREEWVGLDCAWIIKGGVACGDGWEATGSELNEYVAQHVALSWSARDCTRQEQAVTPRLIQRGEKVGSLVKGGTTKVLVPLYKRRHASAFCNVLNLS